MIKCLIFFKFYLATEVLNSTNRTCGRAAGVLK